VPVAPQFAEHPLKGHRSPVRLEKDVDTISAFRFRREAQSEIRVWTHGNSFSAVAFFDDDRIPQLLVLPPRFNLDIPSAQTGQGQSCPEPTDHQRVLEIPDSQLAVLLGPIATLKCPIPEFAGNDLGAALAQGVNHLGVAPLGLLSRPVEVSGVVKLLEPAQNDLVRTGDKSSDLVRADEPVVGDQADDLEVASLYFKRQFPKPMSLEPGPPFCCLERFHANHSLKLLTLNGRLPFSLASVNSANSFRRASISFITTATGFTY
jgi:hypothetical protein